MKGKFLVLLFFLVANASISFASVNPIAQYFKIPEDSIAQSALISSYRAYLSKGQIKQDSLGRLFTDLGVHFYQKRDFVKTRAYVDSSFFYLKSSERKVIQATNYILLALLAMEEDDNVTSIQLYNDALAIYQETHDTLNYTFVLRKIGNNYDYLGDHETAREFYDECISYAQRKGEKEIEAACYSNIGGMYNEEGNNEEALKFYLKGVELAEQTTSLELQHKVYHGTALALMGMNKFAESKVLLNKSMKVSRQDRNQKSLGFTIQGFGFLYLFMNQLDSSEYYFNKTLELATAISNAQLQTNARESLEQIYFKTGRFEKAYKLSKINEAANDSIYNIDNARLLATMRTKYQSEKRERELAEKNLQLREAGYVLDRQRALQTGLFIVVALLVVIIFLVYRQFVLRNRANSLLSVRNQEIQKHAEHVENLNQTKSRWFINVAHELRTPLTLIKGPINRVLSKYDFPDDVREDLILVERNANSLSNLVNEILDLSKLEEGKIKLKESVFNICDLTGQICEAFHSRAEQLGVKIYHKCLQNVHVRADDDKIQKILVNLISNALKFTPKGGKIEVMVQVGEELEIIVKDTGKGISPSDVPFVFDRFFQSSDPTDDAKGGTGIGLALSKEIAIMHDGQLKVSSQPGVGSAFTLVLPKSRIETEQITPQVSPKTTSVVAFDHKPTLLLVEDNEDMRRYVSSLLSQYFEVVSAKDGEQALLILQSHNIRFIISDVMMSGMDGISFLKKVKADPLFNHLPFIHLSAVADEKVRKEALRIGIDDFLIKPFDPEELTIRVKNLYDNFLNRSSMDVGVEGETYDDKVIKVLHDEVISQIEDSHFNVLRLASAAAMSERQLYRYLKSATGLTPLQFIQEIKLNHAMELLKKKHFHSAADLANAVGFKQASYFSSLFEKRFGKKPTSLMK